MIYILSFGFWGSEYKSCYDQAEYIIKKLRMKKYDDKWSFNFGHSYLKTHTWVEAESNNACDPLLKIDPWANFIQPFHPFNVPIEIGGN